jgi:hypothetical protein
MIRASSPSDKSNPLFNVVNLPGQNNGGISFPTGRATGAATGADGVVSGNVNLLLSHAEHGRGIFVLRESFSLSAAAVKCGITNSRDVDNVEQDVLMMKIIIICEQKVKPNDTIHCASPVYWQEVLMGSNALCLSRRIVS